MLCTDASILVWKVRYSFRYFAHHLRKNWRLLERVLSNKHESNVAPPARHAYIENILLVTTIIIKYNRTWNGRRNWFWKKDDQPLRVNQSNHLSLLNWLRLVRTDTAVYHMNQTRHQYPALLPTNNHAIHQHKNILFINESESGCRFTSIIDSMKKALQWRHNCRLHLLDGAAHTFYNTGIISAEHLFKTRKSV